MPLLMQTRIPLASLLQQQHTLHSHWAYLPTRTLGCLSTDHPTGMGRSKYCNPGSYVVMGSTSICCSSSLSRSSCRVLKCLFPYLVCNPWRLCQDTLEPDLHMKISSSIGPILSPERSHLWQAVFPKEMISTTLQLQPGTQVSTHCTDTLSVLSHSIFSGRTLWETLPKTLE